MKTAFDLPEQIRSLSRFPIPVALATSLAVLLNLQLAHVIHMSDSLESELIFACAGAFLASFAAHLWAIGRNLGISANLGTALTAAGAAVVIQYFRGDLYSQSLIALFGLALATMDAAHLRRAAAIESFWRFNLQLGIAVAMALVALLIVCGGLSLLLGSLTFLFDFKFGNSYEHIWSTGLALFAPLFAASMVPAEFNQPFTLSPDPDLIEKSVSAVLNFALVPLILVYSVVLHIYAAKIAIVRSMPKGEIGWLVLAFGAIGTASYMVAYPWRDAGYRPVRWFMRSWFWLMIVPTVLLVLAVWQRISEYGVTPERYCLVLFALWLAAMVAYLGSARGRMDLRIIPASLASGLVLSSFGPWGAAAISVQSQLAQFQNVLNGENLLSNGQLKLDPPRAATFKHIVSSNKRVASILKSLYDLDALERLAPIFSSVRDSPFTKHQDAAARLAALGLTQWGYPVESALSPPTPVAIGIRVDTGAYNRLIGPFWITRAGLIGCASGCPQYTHLKIGGTPLSLSGTFVTAGRNGDAVSFDLAPILDPTSRGQEPKEQPAQTVTLDAREGHNRALLMIVRPPCSIDGPSAKFESWILVKSATLTAK
jgi:hypothetical protein